jgi:hypothetical protein
MSHRGLKDYELDDMTVYEFIRMLDEVFPRTIPDPDDDIRHIMYKAGARGLIETLLTKMEREINERINAKISV